jgi:hypothetical protein
VSSSQLRELRGSGAPRLRRTLTVSPTPQTGNFAAATDSGLCGHPKGFRPGLAPKVRALNRRHHRAEERWGASSSTGRPETLTRRCRTAANPALCVFAGRRHAPLASRVPESGANSHDTGTDRWQTKLPSPRWGRADENGEPERPCIWGRSPDTFLSGYSSRKKPVGFPRNVPGSAGKSWGCRLDKGWQPGTGPAWKRRNEIGPAYGSTMRFWPSRGPASQS